MLRARGVCVYSSARWQNTEESRLRDACELEKRLRRVRPVCDPYQLRIVRGTHRTNICTNEKPLLKMLRLETFDNAR